VISRITTLASAPTPAADVSREPEPAAARSASITALEHLGLSCAFALGARAGISWATVPALLRADSFLDSIREGGSSYDNS